MRRQLSQGEDTMIDQVTINRRDILLVGSSILAATAMSAAQTQMPDRPKYETDIPPSIITPNELSAWASRGRRVS
jgi:hypothetical protein